MKDVNRIAGKVISLMLVAAVLSILFASIALAKRDEIIYPSNLSVGGISIANLNKQDALNILKTNLKSKWGDSLQIKYKDSNDIIAIPLQDCGISYDLDATMNKVEDYVDSKNNLGFPWQHSILRGEPININPVLSFKNRDLFYAKLLELKKVVDTPAENARVIYNNNKGYLEYIVHKNGSTLDVVATMNLINESLANGSLGPIKIVTSELYPKVKTEDIQKVKELLAVYIKELDEGKNAGRDLKTLIDRLNGSIVMPGDTFSMSALLTNKDAPLIDNQYKDDMNKSMSEMANAIYNACLPAHFEIITRPSPQDNFNDIKFRNGLDQPILLSIGIEEGKLVVRIFGCQTEAGKEITLSKEQIILTPELVTKIDPQLAPQQSIIKQEGQNGMRVRSYRIVKKNGKEISKDLLSEEVYPPVNTIMIVAPDRIIK